MNKEDIQKLIGGYATGSLTDQERRELFEAALDDQELFDALQQEQSLKDLFDDPFSRELVRRAAAESLPQPQTSPRKSWFRQPWIWASATSLAMAAVLVVALVRWDRTPPPTNRAATVRERPQPVENGPTEPQPPPKAEAGKPPAVKPPADQASSTTRLERRSGTSKESPRGSIGGASGAGTGGGGRNADSVQLAQNREHDLRDADMPRKDDRAAAPPSPAPPSQNQVGQGRQGAAIPPPPQPASPSQSQVQFGQRPQGPAPQQLRQSEQIQVQAQAPPVPPAVAVPDARSKTADQDKARPMAITTETSGELKSATTSQPKSKTFGNAAGLAKKAEPQHAAAYSFARRADNDTFVEVPADTVFRTGEIVRVIIAPSVSGPLSIWESDAANPEWRRLFPAADSKKVSMRAKQDYAVPVDIVVQKDQRLRVTTGSAVSYISIRTESLPAK